MSKYILFDALTGALTARYDSNIHGDKIPEQAVEVTDEVFFKSINEQDGIWAIENSVIVKKPVPPLTDAQLAEVGDRAILLKIEMLEKKSIRAMREAILTNDKSVLMAVEAEIVVERDKLKVTK